MYDGIQYGNNDISSLQKISRHLFSICANSASCERLFSMFGITLTRLRSRLRPQAMINLAELQMHLRDEHNRSGVVNERLKRAITSHSNSTQPLEQQQQALESPDEDEIEGEPTTTSFQGVVEKMVERVAEDEDDSNAADEGDPNEQASRPTQIRISTIFDFNNEHWTRSMRGIAIRGLAEEMELYELVDLDAEGEIDPDYSVHDMMQATL
jgi:hypothetical protein